MRYFLDTEFLEGIQKDKRLEWAYIVIISMSTSYSIYCFKYNYAFSAVIFIIITFITIYLKSILKTQIKPTIDLISIGIVDEKDNEYYTVSKDFNLKEAWNRFQINDLLPSSIAHGKFKEYWIRENVLFPIFKEFLILEEQYRTNQIRHIGYASAIKKDFTYRNFKRLLKKYGKTNKQIKNEIKNFVYKNNDNIHPDTVSNFDEIIKKRPIEFYAYYADYDWVVFCWLFGKMIELPKGFPKYCIDLKQTLDEKINNFCESEIRSTSFKSALKRIKNHENYPKQDNAHNALDDAKFNKKLYEFLKIFKL